VLAPLCHSRTEPSRREEVNVRYEMALLHQGDIVQIDFSRALQLVDGTKLPLPPIVVHYY